MLSSRYQVMTIESSWAHVENPKLFRADDCCTRLVGYSLVSGCFAWEAFVLGDRIFGETASCHHVKSFHRASRASLAYVECFKHIANFDR